MSEMTAEEIRGYLTRHEESDVIGECFGVMFDRWLAEVKAQAFEEGMGGFYEAGRFCPNPYRQGETE